MGKGELNNIPVNIEWNQNHQSKNVSTIKIDGKFSSNQFDLSQFGFLESIDGDISIDLSGEIKNNQIKNADISLDLTKSKINIDFINYIKKINEAAMIKFNYKNGV